MDDNGRNTLFVAVAGGGMLTFKQTATLVHLLAESAAVPGDVCEFGVNAGNTACLMASLVCQPKKLWLYDSCTGMPLPKAVDGSCLKEGDMKAMASDIEATFSRRGIPMPALIPAFFKDVKPDQLPEKIAFAHVDADLYQSTLDALALIYPRLSVGGIVLFHDWNTPHLPGMAIALTEFMADKPEEIVVPRTISGSTGMQAYFVKK